MEKSIDYIELIRQAQLGRGECPNRLAEAVRLRLYGYVYRYTLEDDLTNDIVQESIVKMLEAIGELREVEKFWPWLYAIARNKIYLHNRQKKKHITVSDVDSEHYKKCKGNEEMIAGMVYKEFKEAVFAAMSELKPEHRCVINMRCYDQMKYGEIGESLGCSEFAAQKLFYRAKKSLQKKLVRRGLGKGSLGMSLVLFGKLTATSKAGVESVAIGSATTKVGWAAAAAVIAASKSMVATVITAGVLVVGGVAVKSLPKDNNAGDLVEQKAITAYSGAGLQEVEGNDNEKYWYYRPGDGDSVMMRVEGVDKNGDFVYCKYIQNAEGNYYFDEGENTVEINNYRQWREDLRVWELPGNLAGLEGKRDNEIYVNENRNILGEDIFKYDWPANAKVVDNRDLMHRRGWTYFKVRGSIDGEMVRGYGRIPFVYSTKGSHWPWMRLFVGNDKFLNFGFTGLSRPWSGLHTIDVVRRDAARKKIPFETKLRANGSKAEVLMRTASGKVVYTIDMEKDVVEKILFSGERNGLMIFDYLQDVSNAGPEFSRLRGSNRQEKAFSILK